MKNHLQSLLLVLPALLIAMVVSAQSYPSKMPGNIAQFKPVKQSSTAGEHRAGAYRAVDGNTDGNWGGLSVTHTGLEKNPWFEVDLLDIYKITDITLYNRTDCCMDRLNNFTIMVSNNPMEGGGQGALFAREGGQIGKSKKYTGNQTGRYVRIRLEGPDNNVLNLAEVVINGTLEKSLPRLNDNLALGKPCRQSSNYEGWAVANLANDGNTEGNWFLGSVATTNGDLGAWWEVDLGEVYDVSEVIIYNRTDCCPERLDDFEIKYAAEPIRNPADGYIFQSVPKAPPIYGVYAAPGESQRVPARYIRIALKGRNILSLTEVQVKGKPVGKIVNHDPDIYNVYWTYQKETNPGKEHQFDIEIKTSKSAGYQLEKAFNTELGANLEYSSTIGTEIPGILTAEATITVGASISSSKSKTLTANQNRTIEKSRKVTVPISEHSTVYYFTQWKEKKARTVVEYDGVNWPYTATVAVDPTNEGSKIEYKIGDAIAPELKDYAAGVAIPDEVFQKILAHNISYEAAKRGGSRTTSGSTNSSPSTNNPTPNSYNYTSIQNYWKQGNYILCEGNMAKEGAKSQVGESDQWNIVPANDDWFCIQSKENPSLYLNRAAAGGLEVVQVPVNAPSALWKFIPTQNGFGRLQNKQYNNEYIHNEYGKLDVGTIEPGWWSAMWKMN